MNVLWLTIIFGGYLLYKSYYPVKAKCINPTSLQCDEETALVDLRDYNISAKHPMEGAVALPYAYLKRYHQELNGKKLYVIAPDLIVRNLSVRFLKNHGHQVLGYCIIQDEKTIDELQFKKCS